MPDLLCLARDEDDALKFVKQFSTSGHWYIAWPGALNRLKACPVVDRIYITPALAVQRDGNSDWYDKMIENVKGRCRTREPAG